MGYFGYDSDYEDIKYDSDPKQITNVSKLRHYINCHGITPELLKFLKLKEETVIEVYENCFGNTPIGVIKSNAIKAISDAIKTKESIEETKQLNDDLVELLYDKRINMCSMGTRRVKCFLNKQIKNGDKNAELLKLALEIEDANILAKEHWNYSTAFYNKKKRLIDQLVQKCKENNIVFGIQKSDVEIVNHIIYFELPNCEQISFHNTFDSVKNLPIYDKEWDGKRNSTLLKLENAIEITFKDSLEEYRKKFKK